MKVVQHTPELLMLKPRAQGIWMLVGGLIFAVAGLVFVVVFGSTVELTCERIEPSSIQCEIRQHILGVTLRREQVDGLRGSKVVQQTDSDGDRTYRIVLLTRSGEMPLQRVWSSGAAAKEDDSTQINHFVQQTSQKSFTLQERGGFPGLLFTGLFVVVGCIIAFLGVRSLLTLWIFDRSGGVVVRQVSGLGGARIKEYPLDDVVAVDVESSRSSNSSTTYRVALYLGTGERVPLTTAYSSGYRRKAETARIIQEFLGLEGSSPQDLMQTINQLLKNR